MKKIIWFWNFIHYSLYLFFKYAGNIITYLITSLFNVKKIKDSYNKKGVSNPKELIANILNDPSYGSRIMFAGAAMNVLMFLLLFGIYSLLEILNVLQIERLIKTTVIILILIAYVANYFLIFKDDLYLNYFKEYYDMKKGNRIKNFIISIFVCILIISFFVLMFLTT